MTLTTAERFLPRILRQSPATAETRTIFAPDMLASARHPHHHRNENPADVAGFSSIRRFPCVISGFLERPFAQDLGGALFADLDHACKAPFRAFLDAAVEGAGVFAHAEKIVGAVEAEVGAEAVREGATGTAVAGEKSGSSRPADLVGELAGASRKAKLAEPAAACPSRPPGRRRRRRRAQLMMPPRLRVSVSMRPGPATAWSSNCVSTKSMAFNVTTSPRFASMPAADDTIFCISCEIGVDLGLVGGFADHGGKATLG